MFPVVVVLGEAEESFVALVPVGGSAVEVDEAEVGVVGGVLVDAVLVVGGGAVAVVVVRLPVLGPAAHGRVGGARDGALEVLQGTRPLRAPALRRALEEDPDMFGVFLQYVRGGIGHASLDVLLPVGAAVEEHRLEVEVIAAPCGVGEGDLLLTEVELIAQRLDSPAAKLREEVLLGGGGARRGDAAGGVVNLLFVGRDDGLGVARAIDIEAEAATQAFFS